MSIIHPDQSEILVPTNAEEGERIEQELLKLSNLRDKLEATQVNIGENLAVIQSHIDMACNDDKTSDSDLHAMKVVIQKYRSDLQSVADQLLTLSGTERFYKAQYNTWEKIHVAKT